MLPISFYLFVVAIFGLIIGSFLNVVIYRLHTGRSLNDRSHCLSCGRQLRWYELFPVISYFALRGRCLSCHSFVPYRYSVVEVLTAAAFVMAFLRAESTIHFILLALLLSILIVGLVYDLYHMIIPDEVSYGALLVAATIIFFEITGAGEGTRIFINAVLGSLTAFLAYASLWYFSRGRAFGFGDAKLAISLGALVGIYGVLSLIMFSFWIGALISVVILSWQKLILNTSGTLPRGARVTMKSEIPFAPFLLAAFILVYFFQVDALGIVENLYVGR